MKKSKLRKLFTYLGIAAMITTVFFVAVGQNTIYTSIEYDEQIMVSKPTKIDITTKKGLQNYSPDAVHIEIYNKYNKDARVEADLVPYLEGEYSMILTPNYTGEYIINIQIEDGQDTYTKSDSFVVN